MSGEFFNILLVEDSPTDARTLERLLCGSLADRFFLQQVVTLEAGLEILGTKAIDVVLLDLDLPDSNGMETLQSVRAQAAEVAIIILSGHDDEALAMRALAFGVQDYLVKGDVRGSKLVRTIHYAVQRKRTLRASEARHRAVLETALDGIITIDQEGRIVAFNPAAERTFGYPAAEALGRSLHELIIPQEYREVHLASLAQQQNTAQEGPVLGQRLELPARCADGQPIIVELAITRNPFEDPPLFTAYLRDITQRKREEEELRWKTAFFEAQVHSSVDGILVVDGRGKKILQNQRCADLFKLPAHVVAEEDGEKQIPWLTGRTQDPARFIQTVAHLNAHPDESSQEEIELIDGKVLDCYSAPVISKEGQYFGRIWTFRDITSRKEAEEKMANERARFQSVFESMPVGVALCRQYADGRRERVINDAHLRICGLTREEEQTPGIYDRITHPDDSARHAELHRQFERGETDQISVEKRYVRLDGKTVWVLFSLQRHSYADGVVDYLTAVVDVTEHKKLEQQFLRSQRLESIGTLAGGIAHDLNNALTPIIMSLDLLRARFPDPPSQKLLGIIAASAERGADMVRQVLSFARGVDGRKVEVHLGHLLEDVRQIAEDTFLKHIQVRALLAPDLWSVTGDPTQIHQVLLNLCVNARDAMPGGGTLTLSAENIELDGHYAGLNPDVAPGAYVSLGVADSGTGMAPETLEKIFDPFFTTKEVGKGTGLGLSTSLAIVKSHGGFLRVSSEPGKGTTFQVGLPARTRAAHRDAEQTGRRLARGSGEWVLVIDDEAAVRELTRYTLEAHGYRAILAADGAEAVAIYASRGAEIAVVFTDMMMPEMDGPTTVRILRKMNPAVRVIGASGLLANRARTQGADLDIKHFLHKPYTADALLALLKQVLHDP